MDEKVFTRDFSLNELIDVCNNLKKKNFFTAGHKIHLANNPEMSQRELEEFIKQKTNEVFGSNEAKELFDSTIKLFKNKETRDFASKIIAL